MEAKEGDTLVPASSEHTRTRVVETGLEKSGYLPFRRVKNLSSFTKRNAIVASKDTSCFNFGVVVRRPLSSSLKRVSAEENVLSVFV